MKDRSIRFRLTIWYALALSAGLILFAGATWLSMRQSLIRDLNRALANRAQSSQAFVKTELADPKVHLNEELDEYSHGFPRGSYIQVSDEKGAVLFSSNPDFPWQTQATASSKAQRVTWNGHSYLLLVDQESVNGQRWQFATTASLEEVDTTLNRLGLLLIFLLPAVIVVASFGGTWLSRRALRPVDELTAAAKSISLENLSERLSVPRTGDELERLAETWNSMLSRLEQTMKRLSRFAADASHELRTPVSVIRTTAELASRRARSADSYREALDQIARESERMTKLLDDVLLLARVDSDSLELPKIVFDLAPVVADLCSQLKPLAEAKFLDLEFLCSPPSVPVLGNEPAIRRLVLVLLDNAIKYSRASGQVTVALHEEDSHVHLEVIDSGPGIQQDELPHIFERFYRGPQARNGANAGSGLGLSLAAGIAEKHNAKIEVTRSSAQGSIFSVLFQPAPSN